MRHKKQIHKNALSDTVAILVITGIAGFAYSYFTNYKQVSSSSDLQELVLLVQGHCYHIHHWILCVVLVIVMLLSKYIPHLVLFAIVGLLVGAASEDLLYDDTFNIKGNCHRTQLMKVAQKAKGKDLDDKK